MTNSIYTRWDDQRAQIDWATEAIRGYTNPHHITLSYSFDEQIALRASVTYSSEGVRQRFLYDLDGFFWKVDAAIYGRTAVQKRNKHFKRIPFIEGTNRAPFKASAPNLRNSIRRSPKGYAIASVPRRDNHSITIAIERTQPFWHCHFIADADTRPDTRVFTNAVKTAWTFNEPYIQPIDDEEKLIEYLAKFRTKETTISDSIYLKQRY